MLLAQGINNFTMEIQFTTRVFKEGRAFVAHALEIDVSSCGGTQEKAIRILQEAGYTRRKSKIDSPEFIGVERISLPLPSAHAKV